MATTKSRKSTPARKQNVEYLGALFNGLESISAASQALRTMAGCFDAAGERQAEGDDIAAGIRVALAHIRTASDALFGQIRGGTPYEERVQPILDSLWASADIVIVAHAAVSAGRFPDGHGMTVCPIQGTLQLAAERLEALEEPLRRAHAWANGMVTRNVRRHNQEYRRQAAEARP